MSNASQNTEATRRTQSSALSFSQCSPQPNQQEEVTPRNDLHNFTYHVASTSEGSIVVTINASVHSHGICTSCGSDQVRINAASEVYSQSITIGTASSSDDQVSFTISNASQPRDTPVSRENTATRDDTPPQQAQTLSEQTLSQPSTQQSTDEQAMAVDPPQDTSQTTTTTAPRTTQRSSLAALSPNQALQAYLLYQQHLAGIAPQDMIMMPNRRSSQRQRAGNGQGCTPSVIQISSTGGVSAPKIPPASFNAAALPVRTSLSGPVQNQSQSQLASQTLESGGSAASQQGDQSTSRVFLNTAPRSQAINPTSETRRANEGQNEGSQGDRKHTYFDILGALTGHPWIARRLTSYFSQDDLMNTCMASRYFYKFVETNNAFVMGPFSKRVFPYGRKIFNYVFYREFMVYNPHPPRNLANGHRITRTPRLKWLRMLEFRTDFISELMSLFNAYGYALTSKCEKVLFKIWHLMNIPDNHRRTMAIRSRLMWSNLDIFHGIFILAQIESFFAIHKNGASPQEFRRLVMAQKSPVLLRDAMKGTALNTQQDVVRAFVHWCYNPRGDEDSTDLFGNSVDQVGKLQYEYFGHNGNRTRLQRPDELLIRECADRKLDTFKMYSNFYVHSEYDRSLSKIYDTEQDPFDFITEIRREAQKNNTLDTYMDQVLLDNY